MTRSPRMMPVLTRLLAGCALALTGLTSASGASSGPVSVAPTSIQRGPAISQIVASNHDTGRNAVFEVFFYPQSGGAPIRVDTASILARWFMRLHLPAIIVLENTHYAGIASSNLRISGHVRTYWDKAADVAVYSDALPGSRQIVPVLAGYDPRGQEADARGPELRHRSVVHVQNVRTDVGIEVRLRLRDDAARTLSERSIEIGPGTSTTIDQGPSSVLAELASDRVGSLELSSEDDIAVASQIGVEPWPTAAMGFESMPAELASRVLFAPLVATGTWTSRFLLVNPGSEPAAVEFEYRPNQDAFGAACGSQAEGWPARGQIAPGGTLLVEQAASIDAGTPESCWASAVIRSDRALLGSVLLLEAEHRLAAAYRLRRIEEAGQLLAPLPVHHEFTQQRFGSALQVQNPGARPVEVHLDLRSREVEAVRCYDCTRTIPAGGSTMWHSSAVDGLRRLPGSTGFVRIASSGPVLATLLEFSADGSYDAAAYASRSMDIGVNGIPPQTGTLFLPELSNDSLSSAFEAGHALRFLPFAGR